MRITIDFTTRCPRDDREEHFEGEILQGIRDVLAAERYDDYLTLGGEQQRIFRTLTEDNETAVLVRVDFDACV